MTDNFQKAVAMLREDVEKELDSIHDDACRAGLDEDQQDQVMQAAYRRMDALQSKWIAKLMVICAH